MLDYLTYLYGTPEIITGNNRRGCRFQSLFHAIVWMEVPIDGSTYRKRFVPKAVNNN